MQTRLGIRPGVHKLDLPCKDADLATTADVTAYGSDQAEKLRG
jgi:hypothetical protein